MLLVCSFSRLPERWPLTVQLEQSRISSKAGAPRSYFRRETVSANRREHCDSLETGHRRSYSANRDAANASALSQKANALVTIAPGFMLRCAVLPFAVPSEP